MWPPSLAHGLIVLLIPCFFMLFPPFMAASAQPDFQLALHDDRLSLQAQQIPLGDVLSELAHQGRFPLTIGAIEAEQPITLTVRNLPLSVGIRRLLQATSYVVQLAPVSSSHPAPQQIVAMHILPSDPDGRLKRITPRDRPSERLAVLPDEDLTDFATLQHEALEAEESHMRLKALKAIRYHHDLTQGLPILLMALENEILQVQEVVLGLLSDLDQPEVVDAVVAVSERDPNPGLRRDALFWMVQEAPDDAPVPLEARLDDPDPEVRQLARRLLDLLQRDPLD